MTTDRTTSMPRRQMRAKSPKKRPSRAFWIKMLGEFSKSGLSAQAFCRLKNLSPSNFSTWRKRLREEEANTPPAATTFIPLEVRAADNSPVPSQEDLQKQQVPFSPTMEKAKHDAGLSLHLNNGLKISVEMDFHSATLQRLMYLLSSQGREAC